MKTNKKMNKKISKKLVITLMVVASFFKGAYLFYEAVAYAVLGACMIDTAKKEKELEK